MEEIKKDKNSIVCKLSPPVSDPNRVDSCAIEIEIDPDWCDFKREVQELKMSLKAFEERMTIMDGKLMRFVAKTRELDVFLEDSRTAAIGAFCDKVCEYVLDHQLAKVKAQFFEDFDHFEHEGEEMVQVFGNKVPLDVFSDEILKKLAHGSSACSAKHRHVSLPLNVASTDDRSAKHRHVSSPLNVVSNCCTKRFLASQLRRLLKTGAKTISMLNFTSIFCRKKKE